jgi:hypothetical protein
MINVHLIASGMQHGMIGHNIDETNSFGASYKATNNSKGINHNYTRMILVSYFSKIFNSKMKRHSFCHLCL